MASAYDRTPTHLLCRSGVLNWLAEPARTVPVIINRPGEAMSLDEYGVPSEYADLTPSVDWFNAPDFNLQSLCEQAITYGNGFAVTLIIPGGRITGILCDNRRYLRGIAEKIREMGQEDGSENAISYTEHMAKTSFDDVADFHQKKHDEEIEKIKAGGEPEQDVVSRTLTVRHAYLSDAWYVPAGSNASVELGFTRVSLGHVTAWVPGRC